MAERRAAVVVLAAAPRPGLSRTRLEPLLGDQGCLRLQETLVRRAARWAAQVGDPHVAFTPADAHDEIRALAPGARLFAQRGADLGERLAHATAHALAVHDGPVVLVGVESPTVGPRHAAAALDDLLEGCDVSIGPAADGGYYLIALRDPRPEVFALPAGEWGGPRVLALTLEAVARAGLAVGMLRAERGLRDPADAHALLADPLAPADVVAALRTA